MRKLLIVQALAFVSLLLASSVTMAEARSLSFYHTHTGENLKVTYADANGYRRSALDKINLFLGDFRSGEQLPIDPALLDILHALQQQHGGGSFEVISAYRSAQTNAMLRSKGSGVAKKSQHVLGKAIDVRLRNVDTWELYQSALALKKGGVGYYRQSDFIHVDTGRVRTWKGS